MVASYVVLSVTVALTLKIGMPTFYGGRLNPVWVEWLMGWPLGWTDLRPLAMDKFRQWCDSHGAP